MPWNLVCDPWVSWSFYKTTIIRQLTKFHFANCLMIVVLYTIYIYIYIYMESFPFIFTILIRVFTLTLSQAEHLFESL